MTTLLPILLLARVTFSKVLFSSAKISQSVKTPPFEILQLEKSISIKVAFAKERDFKINLNFSQSTSLLVILKNYLCQN